MLLCAMAAIGAEEQRADAPAGQTEQAETQPQEDAQADAARPEQSADEEPSPDVFVPSENISEDFDAPFPVDI